VWTYRGAMRPLATLTFVNQRFGRNQSGVTAALDGIFVILSGAKISQPRVQEEGEILHSAGTPFRMTFTSLQVTPNQTGLMAGTERS